jgi:acyl-CoA synthetase (NDP forming)
MPKSMLSEAKGYDLLKKCAIRVPEHRIVENKDEASKATNEIGFPIVMKIVSPQVIHKSDVGEVIIPKNLSFSFLQLITIVDYIPIYIW